MTRDEMQQAVWWLRQIEGLGYDRLSRRVGTSKSTVRRWVIDPDIVRRETQLDNERKRRWDREHYRGTCPCGNRTIRPQHGYCGPCSHEMTSVGGAMRRERIHAMWHEGLSLREIAERMGTTLNSIGVTIDRMRRTGWDMPYRYARRRARA